MGIVQNKVGKRIVFEKNACIYTVFIFWRISYVKKHKYGINMYVKYKLFFDNKLLYNSTYFSSNIQFGGGICYVHILRTYILCT